METCLMGRGEIERVVGDDKMWRGKLLLGTLDSPELEMLLIEW